MENEERKKRKEEKTKKMNEEIKKRIEETEERRLQEVILKLPIVHLQKEYIELRNKWKRLSGQRVKERLQCKNCKRTDRSYYLPEHKINIKEYYCQNCYNILLKKLENLEKILSSME